MSHPVIHFQIVTPNPDKLVEFYTRLFDWQVNADNPLNYRMLDTGSEEGINGGVWPAPPEAHSFVQIHVQVEDVDVEAHLEKAKALGASVIIPPQTLPDGGTMAVIKDPSGVPLALSSPSTG